MKKYTIDWWQQNISLFEHPPLETYQNHLKEKITQYKYTNLPETKYLDYFKYKNSSLLYIPYAIKDNISLNEEETYAGSNILKTYSPPFTATIVDLLMEKGFIPVMKTILDELGMDGTGLSSASKKVISPWSKKRIVGGSSSGSCLAVATGMVPFAIGSDTGDSVRRPAALNGIVGFKPSWGNVSRFGLMPYSPSLDTIAWFTNNISDARLIFSILNKNDKNDQTMNTKMENIKRKLNRKIIIGYDKELIHYIKNKEISKKYLKVINFIKTLKQYKLVEISKFYNQKLIDLAWSTYAVISFTEALSSNFNLGGIHFGKQHKGFNFSSIVHNNRKIGFGDNVKKRFSLAALCLYNTNQRDIYIKAKKVRTMIQEMFNHIYSKVDLVIYPSSDDIAPLIDTIKENKIEQLPNKIIDLGALVNLNGHTALTLPIGYAKSKSDVLPFSITVEGKTNYEYISLNFAQEIENFVKFKNKLHEGKKNV